MSSPSSTNGVTGPETHFYRNHSWLFFKVFGLGGNGFWTIPRSATSSHRPESAGELPLCAILQDAGKKDWRAAAEFLRLDFERTIQFVLILWWTQ